MSRDDLIYILERQAEKKRLAEIEEMEKYAKDNNTTIHFICDSVMLAYDTGIVDPETGDNENIIQMVNTLNMNKLKQFIQECKAEMV
jgi:hypothetical protein